MNHRASPRFWRAYRGLSKEVRQQADPSYELLKDNPAHPSLHLKKVGRFWSVRIGLHYRAVAVGADTDLVWFWIGSHADYDRLLGGEPAKRTPQAIATKTRARKRKPTRRGR